MVRTTPFHERTSALNETGLWEHWSNTWQPFAYQMSDDDGEYPAALLFIPKVMDLAPELRADLDRQAANGIPNAIRFRPAIDMRTAANGPTI